MTIPKTFAVLALLALAACTPNDQAIDGSWKCTKDHRDYIVCDQWTRLP